MEELFKKIYIKSESDLPKEMGVGYVACNKELLIYNCTYSTHTKNFWLTDINWYLQPIHTAKVQGMHIMVI